MAPPRWAYQVENFVSKPDEELVCSICHAIFCDPVTCPCDHVFCRVCITKWLQNSRNCPICRKRVSKYSIKQMVPIVKNLILKLTLNCRNKEHGCDTQFTLEGCESHMKQCNFELVPCKNKPCQEKLFRKDIVEHETTGCPHRYIKCKSCGSKMSSLSSPEDHDCIKSLLGRLKEKNNELKKKNGIIKKLKSEIKSLKNTANSEPSPSSISSISPEEIMINIAEIESSSALTDSDSSSENFIAIFNDNRSDNGQSDGNQSDSFSGFDVDENTDRTASIFEELNEFQNESQPIDNHDEHQIDSHNDNDCLFESSSVTVDAPNSAANDSEERIRLRRPPKRRYHTPLLSTSDDENGSEEFRSLPSPKRCWRAETDDSPTRSSGANSTGYMEAGPSQTFSFSAVSNRSNNKGTNTKRHFPHRPTVDQKTSKIRNRRSKSTKSPSSQSNAVFERTLALLEQYNLESDPEWLPEYASHRGNTTTDSDSNADTDVNNDSSSCLSDCYYISGDNTNDADPNILHESYNTSDDDTDWRPGLED